MSSKRIKKPIRRKKKSDYPGEMSFRKALGMNPVYMQTGGDKEYESFVKTLPDNLRNTDTSNYNLRGMWESFGSPKSFEDIKDTPYMPLQDDGLYHGTSVGINGMWLKPTQHPSAWMEYMYGYQLNPEVYKNYNIVHNPEGYFGENQLQYVEKNKRNGGKLYYQEDNSTIPVTVKYGSPEYEQAYNQGTLVTRLSGDAEDAPLRARMLPEVPFEAFRESGQSVLENYPYFNNLTEEEKKYFRDTSPIGRNVRRTASRGREGFTDEVNQFATGLLYKTPLSVFQIPQSAIVEGVQGLRGKDASLKRVFDPNLQRVPSDVWGFENKPGFGWEDVGNFGMDMSADPLNLVGAGLLKSPIKAALRETLDPTGLLRMTGRGFNQGRKFLVRNTPRQIPGSPNAISSVDDVAKNLKDLQEAKKFAKQYGYELPKNLERIAQSNMLTDRTIRGMMNRHNTFVRGVSTNWDEVAKRNPDILKYLEEKGINWKDNPEEAAKLMLTEIPPQTGYGRYMMNEGEDALYTSNSIPTGQGYTYGDGYYAKIRRKNLDYSSNNRKDWINNNQLDYQKGINDPEGANIIKTDWQKRFPTSVEDFVKSSGNPDILDDLMNKVDLKVKNKRDILDKEYARYVDIRKKIYDKLDKEVKRVYPNVKYTHQLEDDVLNKLLTPKELKDLKYTSKKIKAIRDYDYNKYENLQALKEIFTTPELYKSALQNLIKPDKFAHYAFKGNPGEQIFDIVDLKKMTPELWKNKSRAHIGKYSKKLSGLEYGGYLEKEIYKANQLMDQQQMRRQGGKLYYQEDTGELPTVKYGTPEYEQAYNQGTLTTRLSGDPEDFVRARTLPEFKVTPQYTSLSDDLRYLALEGSKGLAELTGVPGTVRFARNPVQSLKGAGNTLVDLGMTIAPFARMNPAGGIQYATQGVNPITGEGSYRAQDVEGAINTLDALGTATVLGSALKAPVTTGMKQAGRYATTQTPLRNAWRLNPNAYQYNIPENTMWRGLGKEGMEDAIQSGVFRSKQNVVPEYYPGTRLQVSKSFGIHPYFTPKFKTAATYGDDFLAEVPRNVANWRNRYGRGKTWSQIADRPIPIGEGRILQKDWLRGYKPIEVPRQLPGSPNAISSVDDVVDFSKYPSQLEAVEARAQRLLSQKHKKGWNEQLTPDLEEKLSTAIQRHNVAGDYPGTSLGANIRGRTGTVVSKDANIKGVPLTDPQKSIIAAHETGHYYSNSLKEGTDWRKYFDFSDLPYRTSKYLKGKSNYSNFSNEIRERAAQLKDYIAFKNKIPLNQDFKITRAQLNDALENYVKQTGLDNTMTPFIQALKKKGNISGFLKEMNKRPLSVPLLIGTGSAGAVGANQLTNQQQMRRQGGKLYYQEDFGLLPKAQPVLQVPIEREDALRVHMNIDPNAKYEEKKKSDVLDLDNALDYLVDTRGGTRDLWGKMADTIGYHESAHTMDPGQLQHGGGPGRGIFQFEAPSLVTAQNRYRRIADRLSLKTDPEILKAKSAIELSPEQQYALFLINLSESKATLKDYADKKLSLENLWLQGHKNKEAAGDRKSFRTSVQKAKDESIQKGYDSFKELGGKLKYARGGSLTSAQDTAQAADLNKDVMRKDIKKASAFEDFMAFNYGVGAGFLDTISFGKTDALTDAGFKALQSAAGHDVNSEEAKRQAGLKGWGNIGGAVGGAFLNPGAMGSAIEEGMEGLGQGVKGIDPNSPTATEIGTALEGMGSTKAFTGLNDKDKIPEGMEGFSKIFMARNGGRFRYGYQGGGHMLNQNMGLTEIDGPSHEEGGVTLPNNGGRPDVEVEGPETIYTPENYVMSEKMKASLEALEFAGITGKAAKRLAGKSYADLSKMIKSKAGDKLRPNDPLSKKMLDKEMKKLMMAHEYDREAKRMQDEAMRSQIMGGSNIIAETPEERAGGYNMYPNAQSIAFPGSGPTSVVPTYNNDPIMVTGADGSQQMLTDEPIETQAPFIEEKMAQGGKMIKRADGSYSRRGLWDNIRKKAAENKRTGKTPKKPTDKMLWEEKRIQAEESKAMGGMLEYGNGGGINNPGFRALPDYVQAKIKSNMEVGGYMGDYIGDDDTMEYGEGGYTVRRSNDRKGKTHVVIGPDGTKKYFGDPKLGERGKSKYGKDAFYARHKKNLAKNPYFRAYARATWEDGGYMDMLDSNVDMVDMETPMYEYGGSMMYGQGGGIHIDPSKRGTFKAQASRMGMGVQEAARTILNAPEGKYSPAMRKKANFARNFAKADGGYMYQMGGEMMPEEMMAAEQQAAMQQGQQPQGGGQEQIIQAIVQMLQQGLQPEQIVGELVKMGIPQEAAIQAVQMVMQQVQQSQGMQQQQQAAPPFEQGMMGQQAAPATMRGGGRMYQMGGSLADNYLAQVNQYPVLKRGGGKLYYQQDQGYLIPNDMYSSKAVSTPDDYERIYDIVGNTLDRETNLGYSNYGFTQPGATQYANTKEGRDQAINAAIDQYFNKYGLYEMPDSQQAMAFDFAFNSEDPRASMMVAANKLTPAQKVSMYSQGKLDPDKVNEAWEKYGADVMAMGDALNDPFADEKIRSYTGTRGANTKLPEWTERVNQVKAFAPKYFSSNNSQSNPLYKSVTVPAGVPSTTTSSNTTVGNTSAGATTSSTPAGNFQRINPKVYIPGAYTPPTSIGFNANPPVNMMQPASVRNNYRRDPSLFKIPLSTPPANNTAPPLPQYESPMGNYIAGGVGSMLGPLANAAAAAFAPDPTYTAAPKFKKFDYTPVALQRAAGNQAMANTRQAIRMGAPTQGSYLANVGVSMPSAGAQIGSQVAQTKYGIDSQNIGLMNQEAQLRAAQAEKNALMKDQSISNRWKLGMEAAAGVGRNIQGFSKDMGAKEMQDQLLNQLRTGDFAIIGYDNVNGTLVPKLAPAGVATYNDGSYTAPNGKRFKWNPETENFEPIITS